MSLGLGIGWRRELALYIERAEGLGFVEVMAEQVPREGPIPPVLHALRARGVKVVVHGVSLCLGGAARPDPKRLDHLAFVAERLQAELVSEHICFVRAGGLDSGHLLPLPRTEEALEILCENVAIAARALPVPLALENIAALFAWPDPELDEASFVARAVEQTGTRLLLDAANLYANARNLGIEVDAFLDRMPLDRLAYVHVAGGIEQDGLYHDTHVHPLQEGALEVLGRIAGRVRPPGVMLEWDDRYPSPAELDAQLALLSPGLEARGG